MIALLRRPFFGTPISTGEAIFWIALSPALGAAVTIAMAVLP